MNTKEIHQNNIKKYNLNLKKVFILLIISILFVVFAFYMVFLSSDEEKYNLFLYELKYSIGSNTLVFGYICTCGVFEFLIVLYML